MGDSAGGFFGVFEQRVNQLRKRLRDELDKDKPIRCKRTLKGIIKEIKEWEGVLKQHRKEERRCPHCNGRLG
jgi:DNA-directed RNA polymerase subunit RPC12/RpoP